MALSSAAHALARFADGAPLTPDEDEARRWAEQELSDPAYDIAEPTVFDRIARAIGEFFASLFDPDLSGGLGSAFTLIAAIVVAVVIIAAFLVWGLPRATRRAARTATPLFDEADERAAAQLRADAEAEARAGRWEAAIVLRMRALARSCLERGVVDLVPGATVHAFARAAARPFPAHADALEAAARAFDDVRYLRRPGTPERYRAVAETDEAVLRTRPVGAAEPERVTA